eukprot:TRINITY_DN354_c0_g1_i1.p2 TRINITY_DN354_c0_g1~~TRINITY_DN354_c0_g1_i1.p2  ORF type:complete len:166 (+),score=37.53 TRINITY_DN354_c0_g1_i1:440-937(+)
MVTPPRKTPLQQQVAKPSLVLLKSNKKPSPPLQSPMAPISKKLDLDAAIATSEAPRPDDDTTQPPAVAAASSFDESATQSFDAAQQACTRACTLVLNAASVAPALPAAPTAAAGSAAAYTTGVQLHQAEARQLPTCRGGKRQSGSREAASTRAYKLSKYSMATPT